jgi:hypothetical protein
LETFLATMGQVFVRLVEMHGIDARALVREAGVDPAVLRDLGELRGQTEMTPPFSWLAGC